MSMGYQELTVWQRGAELCREVYFLTRTFPEEERYGLCLQLRRASISVISNIAEGKGRNTNKDFIRFLSIARGSVLEVEAQLLVACMLGFINQDEQVHLTDLTAEIGRMLSGLMRALKQTNNQ